eukprot:4712636-Pyramimonas_sp.AAC.1
MALQPEALRRPGRARGGIGAADAPVADEDPSRRKLQLSQQHRLGRSRLLAALAHARQYNRVPMQADTSRSFQLDKGKMPPAPGGLRLVHCFGVFWVDFTDTYVNE